MSELTDLTSKCIRCGFCLESCPTYSELGEESESPRGRIYLVRSVEEGKLTYDDIRPHLDLCLGCRACETACPSGVEYGKILECARSHVDTGSLVDQVANPKKNRMLFRLAGLLPGRMVPAPIARSLGAKGPLRVPQPQARQDWAPLRELPEVRGQVVLLEGCVMGTLFPNVQEASRRLLRRIGFEAVMLRGQCCGALHLHQGRIEDAHKLIDELQGKLPAGLPLVTDSAGCGSTMKELLNTPVFDICEFLYEHGLADLLRTSTLNRAVAYHPACHLIHAQHVKSEPLALLRSINGLKVHELEDMCCGSAGVYSSLQPEMARRLRDRKLSGLENAEWIVMGNPGCHSWIQLGTDLPVKHTVEVFESALTGR